MQSMAFRVEVTQLAKRDAREILKWLDSQQAGEAGLHWLHNLETRLRPSPIIQRVAL
jgi:hypothetical protein